MNIQYLWNWRSNTFTDWCKEVTHWKISWCWERLKAGGEGDNRGWNGWLASPTRWTWVWASSRSWLWSGRPGMLQSMESQTVWHYQATELNWTDRRLTHISTITFLFTMTLITLIHIIPFSLNKINIKTIHMNILCCVLELIITLVLSYFFKCLFEKFVNSYFQEKMPQILFLFKKSDNKT